MNCPKCGRETTVRETTPVPEDSTIYRLYTCDSCDHSFYTAEILVEFNSTLKNTLKNHATSRIGSKKRRKKTNYSNYSNWVKVRCIDSGEIFESVSDAARSIDVHHTSIILCCQGKHKTAGGKRWEYYNKKEVKEDES